MPRAAAILDFWFGPLDSAGLPGKEYQRRWFTADEALDAEIRARFEPDLRNAASGRLQRWQQEPRSALALAILCDQFSRNMYRGTPRAFLFDERARAVSEHALAQGFDEQLWPIERVFLFMPLEHAEDAGLQAESVRRFSALVEQVPPEQRELFQEFLAHAEAHRRVIERFGRFPHRNAVLDRESTAEERMFLEEGATAWGQAQG